MHRNNIQNQRNPKNKQIKQNGAKQEMPDIPLNNSSDKQNENYNKKQTVKYRQQQQPVQQRQNEKWTDSNQYVEDAQDKQQFEKNSQSAKIGCIRRRRQLLQKKIFKFMKDVGEEQQLDANTQFSKTKFSMKNQRGHFSNTQMKMKNGDHKKNEYGKILRNKAKTEREKMSQQEYKVKDEQTIRRKVLNVRSKTEESQIKQRKSSLKLIHSQKQLLLKIEKQKRNTESNISEIQEINQNLNKITQQKIKIRQRIKIVKEKYQKSEQQVENLKVFFGHISQKNNLTDQKIEQIQQNQDKTFIQELKNYQNVEISQQNIEKTVQNKLKHDNEKQISINSKNKTLLPQSFELQLEKQQIKLPNSIRQMQVSLQEQHYFLVEQIQQLRIISSQVDKIHQQQHPVRNNAN